MEYKLKVRKLIRKYRKKGIKTFNYKQGLRKNYVKKHLGFWNQHVEDYYNKAAISIASLDSGYFMNRYRVDAGFRAQVYKNSKKWKDANTSKVRAYNRKYSSKNKEKVRYSYFKSYYKKANTRHYKDLLLLACLKNNLVEYYEYL